MEHLRIEKDGNVAVIYLMIEPQNQFTTPYFRELCETLDQLAEEHSGNSLLGLDLRDHQTTGVAKLAGLLLVSTVRAFHRCRNLRPHLSEPRRRHRSCQRRVTSGGRRSLRPNFY